MSLCAPLRSFAPLGGAALLAACAAAPGAVGTATGGSFPVTVDGMAFAATVAPGAAGLRPTADGGVPVAGMTVSVRREGAALGMDEGKLAKDAAAAGCAAARGRFDGRAFGAYAGAGVWQFAGACA